MSRQAESMYMTIWKHTKLSNIVSVLKSLIGVMSYQKVEDEHDIEKGCTRANVFCGKISWKLEQAPREFRESYIFRVDDVICKGHEDHYKPILFAFGPYHRGKTNLQSMEEHKWQCLNGMIAHATRRTGISRSDLINKCYQVLEGLEDEARGYYADDTTGLDSDEFLEMLLLDGCFLVDTLNRNQPNGDDPLINLSQMQSILRHDMLLLENQLPFFILEKLSDVMITDNDHEEGLSMLLLSALKSIIFSVFRAIMSPARAAEYSVTTVISVSKLYGKDLEDLVDECPDDMKQLITDLADQEKGRREVDTEKLNNTNHLLELVYKGLLKEDKLDIPVATSTTIQVSSIDTFYGFGYNTYTVTDLSNAGVNFRPVDKQKFYDIQFKNGTLEIPRICITRNTTEGMFRNMIAYEMGYNEGRLIINDYLCFMDTLISSGKDVELLRIHGIIEHFLGDDEAVSTMFNNLGTITKQTAGKYYFDITKQLKHYCGKRTNVWMAKLRSDYFSSPWSIVSVTAAFVLLVLTIIQTVYGPLSYYNG